MDNRAISPLNLLVLILSAGFFIYDLSKDLLEGDTWSHLIPEMVIFLLVIIALGNELIRGIKLRRQLLQHQAELSEFKGGFADKIKQQFYRWQLTPSETEVAWLIIKGFSFAEIARFRDVREKTVRQQATSIYAKSETSNRIDLTSVFLDDLLNYSS